MSTKAGAAPLSDSVAPRTLKVESAAVYAAAGAGIIGAIYGLIIAVVAPGEKLSADGWSYGLLAAIGASVIAVIVSAVGYWRSRHRPGQEWRQRLPSWKFTVNTISVVIVHTVLAFLGTYALFRVLSLGFIGLPVIPFWATVFMALALGMTAYLVFLSVSRMTTQRMTSLLMAFIVIGTLTAMVTTSDPEWWLVHFSRLGTFDDLSSWVFNGTLIAGGLLVTTFAVYLANDMQALVDQHRLANDRSPRIVPALFVVMGVMLAFVGIFPVDVNFAVHNLVAIGMALTFLGLLIAGPRLLRGMPRTYFVSAWAFLSALLGSIVLFVTRYFVTLTAFEIIVFALIFGWIAVFIRFLGVTGQSEDA